MAPSRLAVEHKVATAMAADVAKPHRRKVSRSRGHDCNLADLQRTDSARSHCVGMCAVVLKRRVNRAPAAPVPCSKSAPFPRFIPPCDPTLRDRAPDGPEWLHEIKIDGYRAQVHIHHRRITVYSRSGYNWTGHFHQIAHAVRALSGHDLIIDGEATVFGNTGLPDFQALRRELAKWQSNRLVYLAFDLLYLDGYDLRGAPLIERKSALQGLLAKPPPKLVYVEHFEMDDGEAVYRHAC
jgi:ATP-dependent DNA ligase